MFPFTGYIAYRLSSAILLLHYNILIAEVQHQSRVPKMDVQYDEGKTLGLTNPILCIRFMDGRHTFKFMFFLFGSFVWISEVGSATKVQQPHRIACMLLQLDQHFALLLLLC